MATFNTNDDRYIVRIGGIPAGGIGKPFTDPVHGQEGSIQLDLLCNWYKLGGAPEDAPSVHSNIQLRDLIDALNTIEGVTATYEKPKVHISVPQGIGAVITSSGSSVVRVTRVNVGSGKNWVQNLDGTEHDGWYTDAQMDKFLNEYDYVVLSEGMQ